MNALRGIDVAAGVIWRDGRFLAAQRPPDKPHAGFWEFPGGKLEPGEDAAQALARELAEELDIRSPASRFFTANTSFGGSFSAGPANGHTASHNPQPTHSSGLTQG